MNWHELFHVNQLEKKKKVLNFSFFMHLNSESRY